MNQGSRPSNAARLLGLMVLLGGALVLIAIGTQWIGSAILTRFVTVMYIDLILVLGLQMYMGNSGIVAFAHIGFMGIGAYASALFSMSPTMKSLALPDLYPILADVQIPFVWAVLVGAAIAAVVAAVVGWPLMRLSDFAAVITQFALLVILHTIFVHWSAVTNGPRTLFGLDRHTYLWGTLAWAVVLLGIAYWFKDSKVGLQLRASRDEHAAAAGVGIDIVFVRWVGFVVSAFFAGIGGALWAHFILSFQPSAFYLRETFLIMGMLVIGGPATVTGAVVGTICVTVAFQGLRAVESWINISQIFSFPIVGLTDVALGVALILMLVYRPGGLVERRECTGWRLPALGSKQTVMNTDL